MAMSYFLFPLLGIHSDISEEKQEYWSSFAPLALEAALSIGQKAKDGTLSGDCFFQKCFLLLVVIFTSIKLLIRLSSCCCYFHFYEAVGTRIAFTLFPQAMTI
jgi:hypothetical protein